VRFDASNYDELLTAVDNLRVDTKDDKVLVLWSGDECRRFVVSATGIHEEVCDVRGMSMAECDAERQSA
jgi:hypothetical protein